MAKSICSSDHTAASTLTSPSVASHSASIDSNNNTNNKDNKARAIVHQLKLQREHLSQVVDDTLSQSNSQSSNRTASTQSHKSYYTTCTSTTTSNTSIGGGDSDCYSPWSTASRAQELANNLKHCRESFEKRIHYTSASSVTETTETSSMQEDSLYPHEEQLIQLMECPIIDEVPNSPARSPTRRASKVQSSSSSSSSSSLPPTKDEKLASRDVPDPSSPKSSDKTKRRRKSRRSKSRSRETKDDERGYHSKKSQTRELQTKQSISNNNDKDRKHKNNKKSKSESQRKKRSEEDKELNKKKKSTCDMDFLDKYFETSFRDFQEQRKSHRRQSQHQNQKGNSQLETATKLPVPSYTGHADLKLLDNMSQKPMSYSDRIQNRMYYSERQTRTCFNEPARSDNPRRSLDDADTTLSSSHGQRQIPDRATRLKELYGGAVQAMRSETYQDFSNYRSSRLGRRLQLDTELKEDQDERSVSGCSIRNSELSEDHDFRREYLRHTQTEVATCMALASQKLQRKMKSKNQNHDSKQSSLRSSNDNSAFDSIQEDDTHVNNDGKKDSNEVKESDTTTKSKRYKSKRKKSKKSKSSGSSSKKSSKSKSKTKSTSSVKKVESEAMQAATKSNQMRRTICFDDEKHGTDVHSNTQVN